MEEELKICEHCKMEIEKYPCEHCGYEIEEEENRDDEWFDSWYEMNID